MIRRVKQKRRLILIFVSYQNFLVFHIFMAMFKGQFDKKFLEVTWGF